MEKIRKIILLTAIITGITGLILWFVLVKDNTNSSTSMDVISNENFETTTNKIMNLKLQLGQLLQKSVDFEIFEIYEKILGNIDEYKIANCVKKELKKNDIPIDSFYMDGDTMKEPILQMYQNDRSVYEIIAKCKFLDLIGRIVATAAWTEKDGKTKGSLYNFSKCLDTIDFSDIKIWNTISDPNGIVLTCVKNS